MLVNLAWLKIQLWRTLLYNVVSEKGRHYVVWDNVMLIFKYRSMSVQNNRAKRVYLCFSGATVLVVLMVAYILNGLTFTTVPTTNTLQISYITITVDTSTLYYTRRRNILVGDCFQHEDLRSLVNKHYVSTW